MKSIFTKQVLLFVSVISLITVSCRNIQKRPDSDADNRISGFVPEDTTWKSLTLREKIGQTMIIVSKFYDFEKFEGGNLDTFFLRYPVGGFFMADWYYFYFAFSGACFHKWVF